MVGTERRRVLALGAALTLSALLVGGGQGCDSKPQPEAGRKEYQSLGWVPVPHGIVNMIGGNLLVERSDLDLDTQIGRLDLGATWNSATRDWAWSFEPTFDGETFRDASGASHDVSALAPEAPIPGTHWVFVAASTMRTKGGLVHEFDSTGRLEVVRWRSATFPQLKYVGGYLAGETRTVEIRQYESGSNWTRMATIERDSAGRVDAIEDRAGRRAEYQRDATGRLVVARDALDLSEGWPGFRYEYGAQNQLAAITNSEGERTEYGGSPRRTTLVRRVGLGNSTWLFDYSKTGAISTAELTGPLGGRQFWRYDDQRRVLERESEAGATTIFAWNGLRPREVTTPDGVTVYYHVVNDDLVHVLQPSGNIVDFVWESAGENRGEPNRRALAEIRDTVGLVQARTYDAAGRLATIANGAGDTWQFTWNGGGLLADVTDPAGSTTRYRDYGTHGHPRRVEAAGAEAALDWDAVGNLRSPGAGGGGGAGGVIERQYDPGRNLSRLVLGDLDGLNSTTTRNLDLSYRSDGRRVRIDRPYGGDTEWIYDAHGRVGARREFSDGAWRTTTWEYDAAGRVLARERPNGMRTEWEYQHGRLTRIGHERAGETPQFVTFGWTDGRLTWLDDSATGLESFEYDDAGRIESVVDASGDARILGYDVRSRVVSEFYQLGSGWPLVDVQVEYDLAGREVELRRGSQLLRRRTFSAGRLASEEFGNGLVRTDTYDPADGLLATSELRNGTGAVLAAATIVREVSGLGTGSLLWDAVATTQGAVSATTEEQHRLAPLSPGGPGARIGTFSSEGPLWPAGRVWDELSNPVSEGDLGEPGRRTFHYDSQRTRLEELRNGNGGTVHDYAFDAAGFVTARDGAAVVWDAGGRPLAASGVHWNWDTLGRLRSRLAGGVVTLRRFGGRVETQLDGTPTSLDLGSVVVDLTAGGGNNRFRHLDFRGNVKWVTDMSGTVIAHFGYGPSSVLEAHGASGGEPTFAQALPAGELMLLGHRLYDPAAGRFLAPDPVYQVVNQHGYTLGDPVHFWDPDGREVSPMVMARGVAAGTAIGATVGVASALTLGAPVTAFAFAALGASGVYAGLLVPYSPVATGISASAAAVLYRLRAAPFAGFAAGQFLQLALSDPSVPRGKPEPTPTPDPDPDVPTIGKELELRVEPPSSGCSPTRLADSAPVVPRELLAAAAGAQLVAALALVRRTRRRK
ncbi:MAG: RHS repeat domain-containing protein [Myxococcota bacterium]